METLMNSSSATFMSLSSPFSNFSPRRTPPSRSFQFPFASKGNDPEPNGPQSDSKDIASNSPQSNSKDINSFPILSNRHLSLSPLSKDMAMGLVLNAATGRGWTTGSGMEGPSAPAGIESSTGTENISTFPWSLFTKSPRRRMLVSFTCNICRQRTTRAINPHAYTDGTVFVQCCGCNAFHKLVDNLNLFQDMKCYLSPDFDYRGHGWDNVNFKYLDTEGGDNDIFPIQ
ncbi:hypothetical protein I3843_05G077900 [Carya illinoinensis]|uniref:DNL-type domain-containing protein n=1 Tax=Carya illinoinensis TaxID=32201 RepID=A0A8T1QH00_CARIL|nr:uncharacterized protein LOC122310763 [Carya illinoinensis]KAG6653561.1 hypothetical protein CIPAW_05G085900 [Carya illinoinensis]KAG6653562.1 hypothetical protein CIPAW_05G085900 [Carya illinoinensis]KAG6712019.1 hypothetical protein I3842_05G084400 [Carya illinoinensis]KAG7978343.1 hypothetical protein I3843_05G077900 [Carya illinoinensis]KAG7978344.1 hypothetical protein I3843_05G077900 [Carya illinoinensis]